MYIQYITPVYGRYMLINGDHLQARYIPLYTPLITINPPYIHYIYWLVVFRHPSEKYDFVSWDDISQYGKINVPNHQPDN